MTIRHNQEGSSTCHVVGWIGTLFRMVFFFPSSSYGTEFPETIPNFIRLAPCIHIFKPCCNVAQLSILMKSIVSEIPEGNLTCKNLLTIHFQSKGGTNRLITKRVKQNRLSDLKKQHTM